MTGSLETTLADAPLAAEKSAPARCRPACFHCGEPCPDNLCAKAEKTFCCNGCRVVHELLTESGLGHFYDLRPAPGLRIQRPTRHEQWVFLDEPGVRRQLLDFADDRQSRVTFHIPAIHCIACVWLLENLFRLHPGVGRSVVNYARREVAITFSTGEIKLSELVALLASIGYEPSLTLGELEKRPVSFARRRQWLQVGIAGFAFGNIMLFSLPQYFGMDGFSGPAFATLFGWLSLALALPVVVFSASDYWKSALLSLRQRMLTLDVPIALGLAAIYGQSVYEIAARIGEGYCDSLTGLIFFLLCGRIFQQKTHERLAFDRDYKSFFPLSVTRRSAGEQPRKRDHAPHEPAVGSRRREEADLPDGQPVPPSHVGGYGSGVQSANSGWEKSLPAEERVSLSQLRVGDRIVLRNGELIPADARLVSGPAVIDYSFVTGESEPVARQAGDHLYAGGQQIGAAIEVETIKAVSQSYLTSLWNHEAFHKDRDETTNTLTNRYSRRFTVIVIGVAVGAALFWALAGNLPRGIKAFTSVLIVACPCALALAAPFTLGTAQRWLTRAGAFLKNALVIERLARVNAIVFDKTGTLTSAGVNAVNFHGPSLNQTEARWIASLTRHSTHPLSARIAESFGDQYLPELVHAFRETAGCGIEGLVDGHALLLGSRGWLASGGVDCSRRGNEAETQPEANPPPHVGGYSGSTVHVAIDGEYRGAFALAGTLRPETDELLRQLAERNELALLSGDNERERERFRALFGAEARLNFNQSPLDKLGFIQRLQQQGRTVMMVGDGLNDAGALKQSDVGVAVVEKIGAFSPASDVILDAARVPQLSELLTLARSAARIVKISFGISAAYNVLGVSIAAAGLLSPVVCAVLMPVSSVSVVLFACGVTTWAARRTGLKFDLEQGRTDAGLVD